MNTSLILGIGAVCLLTCLPIFRLAIFKLGKNLRQKTAVGVWFAFLVLAFLVSFVRYTKFLESHPPQGAYLVELGGGVLRVFLGVVSLVTSPVGLIITALFVGLFIHYRTKGAGVVATLSEEYAQTLLDQAVRMEADGKLSEAAAKYHTIVSNGKSTTAAVEAQKRLNEANRKLMKEDY
jgi:hypothetical protein